MQATSISIGIVALTLSRSGGGLFPIVRAHAKGLAALPGVVVTVHGLEDANTEADLDSWRPLRPIVYRTWSRRFGFAPRLSRDLEQGAYDVVHQHGLWLYPSLAVAQWRRRTRKPTVISTQGMLEPWALANSALRKRAAGLAFERSNLVHASCIHCSAAEVEGIRAYGLRNPIAVIPNGVDLSLETGSGIVRPQWMGDDSRRTLLFLGRLHPKKGIRELLTAWSRIAKESPAIARSWRLAIVGWDDAGLAGSLRSLAGELRLGEDSVTFPGALFGDEKAAALSNADAFILPSYSEGFPIAVLEAWAYALPVFMTRGCNIPAGFDAGAAIEIKTDPPELASVLAKSLSRPDLGEVGRRGREFVQSQFSWPVIVAELRTVYDWLTRGGHPPTCVRLD